MEYKITRLTFHTAASLDIQHLTLQPVLTSSYTHTSQLCHNTHPTISESLPFGSGDSSVFWAPDSWLKGRRFESPQERWEKFLFQGQLSVLTHFGIRSTPVLLQQHVKYPSHSARSVGGRLQLNTHAPYVCGFAWSDTVHGCMVYTERAKMAAVSCGTSHASAVSTPLRWIVKKRAIKS